MHATDRRVGDIESAVARPEGDLDLRFSVVRVYDLVAAENRVQGGQSLLAVHNESVRYGVLLAAEGLQDPDRQRTLVRFAAVLFAGGTALSFVAVVFLHG